MTTPTIKDNVQRFNEDVENTGSYGYITDTLSSQYANGRIGEAVANSYDFAHKSILDIGCGDGTYSLEIAALSPKCLLGIDPAENAIKIARIKAKNHGFCENITFEVGNIYTLTDQLNHQHFDCIIFNKVLHHLPDPERAIALAAYFADTLMIVEPNGTNPVLKLLERFSQYHIEHEEQSFLPRTIRKWVTTAGFQVESTQYVNLVPMFCPDWMAKICRFFEPFVEKIPFLRAIACGQVLIIAKKKK